MAANKRIRQDATIGRGSRARTVIELEQGLEASRQVRDYGRNETDERRGRHSNVAWKIEPCERAFKGRFEGSVPAAGVMETSLRGHGLLALRRQ